MNPWDIPVVLNRVADRASDLMFLATPFAIALWVCVCKLGMV